jgi:hypothetical protein
VASGHGDEPHTLQRLARPDPPANLEPVHVRHVQVDEHAVRLQLRDQEQRLHSAGGRGEVNLRAVGLEGPSHPVEDRLLVVHHEDLHQGAAQLVGQRHLVSDEEAPQIAPPDPPVPTRGAEGQKNPPVDPLAHRGGVDLQQPADVVGGVELVHSSPFPLVPV